MIQPPTPLELRFKSNYYIYIHYTYLYIYIYIYICVYWVNLLPYPETLQSPANTGLQKSCGSGSDPVQIFFRRSDPEFLTDPVLFFSILRTYWFLYGKFASGSGFCFGRSNFDLIFINDWNRIRLIFSEKSNLFWNFRSGFKSPFKIIQYLSLQNNLVWLYIASFEKNNKEKNPPENGRSGLIAGSGGYLAISAI